MIKKKSKTIQIMSSKNLVAVFQYYPTDLSVVELENTLGSTTWDDNDTGYLHGVSDNLFTPNKTIIPPFIDYGGDAAPFIPLVDGTAIIGYYTAYWQSPNDVYVEIRDASFQLATLNSLVGNGKLSIEIKVYP